MTENPFEVTIASQSPAEAGNPITEETIERTAQDVMSPESNPYFKQLIDSYRRTKNARKHLKTALRVVRQHKDTAIRRIKNSRARYSRKLNRLRAKGARA